MEWTGDHYWSLRHKIIAFPLLLYKWIKGYFVKKILISEIIKRRINVGVHWGFVLEEAKSYSWVKFNLADKDTAKNLIKQNSPTILLTSKDFSMPMNYFSSYHNNFKWDLLTVSHNSRRKRLLELLIQIRKLKSAFKQFTCVLLINTGSKENTKNTIYSEVNFLKYYYKNFNYDERQDIVLLRVSYEQGLEGVSSNFVYWLMRNSKNFVLFSKSEGSAKVVKEAIDCGSHAWVSKNLKGGSLQGIKKLDYTLFKNDTHFKTLFLEELQKKAVNKLKEKKNIKYSKSIETLENFLLKIKILGSNERFNKEDFIFANKWLPAHHPDQIKEGNATGDILSIKDILKFKRKIIEL